MKPFLGIDLTDNKNNEKNNGDEFFVAKPTSAMTESYEQFSKKAYETIENAKLPLTLRIAQGICGFIAVIIVLGIVKAWIGHDDITIAQAYQNIPWLFWLGGICLSAWVILKLFSKKKEKETFANDNSNQVISGLNRIGDEIYTELSVPADSKEVDILSFFYKNKNGEIKVCEKGLQTAKYFNPCFNIFKDSENLYLANLEGKYAFPLPSFKAIRTVDKRIEIACWNKDEAYNKGYYKQFKLTEDNLGRIHFKRYHILEFIHENELWGIYIPSYELTIFEDLTGLKAEQ